MIEHSENIRTLKRWLTDNQRALQAAHIATIVGTYDGSGDEGTFRVLRRWTEKVCPHNTNCLKRSVH